MNQLREMHRLHMQSKYLQYLNLALQSCLPDVEDLRDGWTETLHVVRRSEMFDKLVESVL